MTALPTSSELRELLPFLTGPERDELDRYLLPTLQPSTEPGSYLSWLRSTLPRSWSADAPHIRLIAEHLDAVTRGEIDRLAIHMPPRHGKTEMTTVRYPLYRMDRDRQLNVLVTGYNERFARKLGRKTRNLAAERGLVASDKSAADEWALTEGGIYMARGVGSPPTGSGFGLILIDDPVRRREDADSEVYREKVWDWYTDDLYTRLEPNGAIVLVMTLWHEDDIGARAVASEPGRWTVLKLPAIAEEPDEMRQVGEALWPERFDATALNRIRSVLVQNEGERSWQALYQQNPTPREGSFFKIQNFKILNAAPSNLRYARAWDLGASTSGDPTAGVKMGTDGEGFYVRHVARGQWATDDRNKHLRQTAVLDGKSCRIHLPRDPGQAGIDQGLALTRLLAGFSVTVEPVSGAKEVRADPWSAQVNAGNVTLIDDGTWDIKAFIEEHRAFPQGKHDDQVDAAADAFSELTNAPRGRAWGGS